MSKPISGRRIAQAVERYESLRQIMGVVQAREVTCSEFNISDFSMHKASKVKETAPAVFDLVVSEQRTLSDAYKEVHQPKVAKTPFPLDAKTDEVIEPEPSAQQPDKFPARSVRKQLAVLSSVEGTAHALAQTCSEVNVEMARQAADPSQLRRFEKTFKQAVAALNQMRRELKSSEN